LTNEPPIFPKAGTFLPNLPHTIFRLFMTRAHQIMLHSRTFGAPCQKRSELHILFHVPEYPLDRLFSVPVFLFPHIRSHLRGHPPPFRLIPLAGDDPSSLLTGAFCAKWTFIAVRTVISVQRLTVILIFPFSGEEAASRAGQINWSFSSSYTNLSFEY